MHYTNLAPLALCLLPNVLATSSTPNSRRDDSVSGDGDDCAGFATASNPGDTCESFAEQWNISVARLEELNPSVDCDDFDDQGFYCVNTGLDDEDDSTSTSTSTSTTTTASATPTSSADDESTTTTDTESTSTSTSTTESDEASSTDSDADATPTSDDADTPTGAANLQAAPGLIGAAASSLIWYFVTGLVA
ncbi:hypothetical protein BDV19DRAFT_352878 [Aspergillus venezuelensis]